jgi:hypothetical protein
MMHIQIGEFGHVAEHIRRQACELVSGEVQIGELVQAGESGRRQRREAIAGNGAARKIRVVSYGSRRIEPGRPPLQPTNLELAQLHVQAVGETRRNSVHLHCGNRSGTKNSSTKMSSAKWKTGLAFNRFRFFSNWVF